MPPCPSVDLSHPTQPQQLFSRVAAGPHLYGPWWCTCMDFDGIMCPAHVLLKTHTIHDAPDRCPSMAPQAWQCARSPKKARTTPKWLLAEREGKLATHNSLQPQQWVGTKYFLTSSLTQQWKILKEQHRENILQFGAIAALSKTNSNLTQAQSWLTLTH